MRVVRKTADNRPEKERNLQFCGPISAHAGYFRNLTCLILRPHIHSVRIYCDSGSECRGFGRFTHFQHARIQKEGVFWNVVFLYVHLTSTRTIGHFIDVQYLRVTCGKLVPDKHKRSSSQNRGPSNRLQNTEWQYSRKRL